MSCFQKVLQQVQFSEFGLTIPELLPIDPSPPETDEEHAARDEEQYIGKLSCHSLSR